MNFSESFTIKVNTLSLLQLYPLSPAVAFILLCTEENQSEVEWAHLLNMVASIYKMDAQQIKDEAAAMLRYLRDNNLSLLNDLKDKMILQDRGILTELFDNKTNGDKASG